MPELKNVPLTSISMIKNYRDVEPPSEKDAHVKELAESIKEKGVLQPVLLRPDAKKKDHYELIFGHRRLIACKVANLETIPGYVLNVRDEDILELQVTENLQRKDVHPMDEAIAFQSLMNEKKYPLEEIASRFGKGKDYVGLRLKLNDLIPELQKDFMSNKMLLGHALLLCRLTPDDQKKAKQEARGKDFRNESIEDVREWIDDYVMQDLSKVPWKLDDKDLLPHAGACSVCQKRSGAGNFLFADLAKDNRCFDSKCFEQKSEKHFLIRLAEVIETKPDVLLVAGYGYKMSPDVNKFIQSMNLKVLKDHEGYRTHNYDSEFKKKAKGFCVTEGYDQGKFLDIYIKGDSSSKSTKEKEKSGKLTQSAISEEIKRIQEREKRSKQLDINKIHAEIEAQAKKNKSKIMECKPQSIDRGIMIYILLTEVGYNPDWRNETMGYVFDKIKTLSKWSEQQLSELIRKIVFERMMHAGSDNEVRNKHTAIRLIAEYAGIDIKAIEKAQQDICDARNERIKKRIEDLNGKKKENKKQISPKKKDA